MTNTDWKDILQNAYQRETWIEALQHIFGGDLRYAEYGREEQNLTAIERNTAQNIWYLGIVKTKDDKTLALYEVILQPNVVIERNRVAVNKLMPKFFENKTWEGALVVFTYPVESTKTEWRFSFVGKAKTIDENWEEKTYSTEHKRYTYIFGTAEQHKTAIDRFEALRNSKKTIQDLFEAFSVEKLSKDFFAKYKQHFDKFWKYLANTSHKADTFNSDERLIRDFCKKLLGRIVFLYFIQKKGWLGVAMDSTYKDHQGNPHFLKDAFEKSEKKDFYESFLCKLFFDTLNNSKRQEDTFELPNGELCKIPYLNGGLFEKDYPENTTFQFPESHFEELFTFFDQYNFTIVEESPDEQQIAIDPDMLGRIFENLLEDNKEKGAYYTPFSIVRYMCAESLVKYLINDFPDSQVPINNLIHYRKIDEWTKANALVLTKKLIEVKICDPAIGSGAFPMGLLKELFAIFQCLYEDNKEILRLLPLFKNGWDAAQVKLSIMQNSIYGVDLEKGAVDIARLRFWLSLIIDEEEPKPLPNLDYKIMQGNSLLESFEGIKLEFDKRTYAQRYQPKQKDKDLFGNIKNPQITFSDYIAQSTEFDFMQAQNLYFSHKEMETKKSISKKIFDFEMQFIYDEILKQINENQKIIETNQKKLDTETYSTKKELQKLQNEIVTAEKTLSNLQNALAKTGQIKPDQKPYFLWHLYFQDIFEINDSKQSKEIEMGNKQIFALNNQIDTINYHLKNIQIDKQLLQLQVNTANIQIDAIRYILGMIENSINEIFGEITAIENQIVAEPDEVITYKLNGIKKEIELVNRQIADINKSIKNKDKMLGGFDIVIGNPPYVQLQKMKEEDKQGFENYATYSKSSDIYCLFYERGIQLLKNNGVLALITSNSWMRTQYGEALRKFFREKTNPIALLNFEDTQIFESATVESNIMITQKAPFSQQLKATAVKPDLNQTPLHEYEQKNAVMLSELADSGWIIADRLAYQIKQEIEKGSISLGKLNLQINIGINTGLNEVFIINEEAKNELIRKDGKNIEILKPVLRGRDLRKYSYHFSNFWLINAHNGLRDKDYKGKDEDKKWILKPINIEKDYPIIFEYLKKFEDKLKNRYDQGWHWTNLRNCAYLLDFDKPKIIWGELSDQAKFTYDESKIFLNNTTLIMTGENLKYILSTLNSKLAQWYFAQISTSSGMGTNRWLKYKVEQFPIKVISKEDMKPFEILVDYILWLNDKENPKASSYLDNIGLVSFFEKVINMMVYELYFPEEMKEKKIDILQFTGIFKDITSVEDSETKAQIIVEAFLWLQKSDNPIRNRIILADIVSEYTKLINSTTY